MLAQPDPPAPLLERYRRPLTFGAVLDETFRLFRQVWLPCAGIMALAVVPALLLFLLLGGTAAATLITNPNYFNTLDGGSLAALGVGLVVAVIVAAVVFSLAQLLAAGAASVLVDGIMRGERPSVWHVYSRSLRRVGALLGAAVLVFLAEIVLVPLAMVLVVVTLGGVCGLVPLAGLVVWAASPPNRRPWLKWLLILTTPFGLPTYFGTRWALLVQAAVLEGAGPRRALRRSSELVRGHWFTTFGVLFIVTIVVSILQNIPGAIVGLLAFLVMAVTSNEQNVMSSVGAALNLAANAAGIVTWILLGAVSYLAATVLFVDVRNRRDGTALAERVALLEREDISAD